MFRWIFFFPFKLKRFFKFSQDHHHYQILEIEKFLTKLNILMD